MPTVYVRPVVTDVLLGCAVFTTQLLPLPLTIYTPVPTLPPLNIIPIAIVPLFTLAIVNAVPVIVPTKLATVDPVIVVPEVILAPEANTIFVYKVAVLEFVMYNVVPLI